MRVPSIHWLGTPTERYAETVAFAKDVLGLSLRFEKDDFEVEDVADARREMEAKHIRFIGPVHDGASSAWSHFYGPDGHVYELTARKR